MYEQKKHTLLSTIFTWNDCYSIQNDVDGKKKKKISKGTIPMQMLKNVKRRKNFTQIPSQQT